MPVPKDINEAAIHMAALQPWCACGHCMYCSCMRLFRKTAYEQGKRVAYWPCDKLHREGGNHGNPAT